MPTYDYQCTAGHNFEKIHKMSESPRVKCPVCGKPAARQISGGAGLVFKGSGFYITDYRSEGYKQAAKKETDATKPASAESKSSKSADSAAKPAAKSESKPGKSTSAAS